MTAIAPEAEVGLFTQTTVSIGRPHIARYFDFQGCDNQNPDCCSCETWEPVECRLCGADIRDGQVIVSKLTLTVFDPIDHSEYEQRYEAWHFVCPKTKDDR